ncbi:hypothetical protein PENSPDRAFT_658297 [Peniophora sp. CONT]|nr:hypothetical protein PENSPDRAFT_658297 [Peniophora sp. CONT]
MKDTPVVFAPDLTVLDLSDYFLQVQCKLLRTLKVDLSGCPLFVHHCSRDQYIYSLLEDSKDTLQEVVLLSCVDPHRWSSFVDSRAGSIRLPHLNSFDVDDDTKEAYLPYLKLSPQCYAPP